MPLEMMYGITPDILMFCQFHFWEPVYYVQDNKWPSERSKKKGHWVGIALNVGDALTYKILTDDTHKIITRSAVRSRSETPNKRLDIFTDDPDAKPVKNVIKSRQAATPNVRAPTFQPDDLLGRTFLMQPKEDGQCF